MLKKTITFTDYDGNERTEDFYFNLNKAEILEMQAGTTGGLDKILEKIIAHQDMPSIMDAFKSFILKTYGEKSDDGRRFMKVDEKGNPLSVGFTQTEAYSIILMELVGDAEKAAEFINGVVPKEMSQAIQEAQSNGTLKTV